MVTPDSSFLWKSETLGAAHYNTPDSFRAFTTPWVEVTFLYPLDALNAQLWMEQETGPGASWTELGAYDQNWSYAPGGTPGFEAYWRDYGSNPDGYQYLKPLATESHTLLLGRRADGTIDYWLDGTLACSTTKIAPQYFGDIYLGAAGAPITFTDYQSGGDYAGVGVPEPGTLGMLLALGLPGLMVWRKRRKSA